jgi:hypothetical protein
MRTSETVRMSTNDPKQGRGRADVFDMPRHVAKTQHLGQAPGANGAVQSNLGSWYLMFPRP